METDNHMNRDEEDEDFEWTDEERTAYWQDGLTPTRLRAITTSRRGGKTARLDMELATLSRGAFLKKQGD